MNSIKMNANVIDEMFPDGSGNVMMELDEVNIQKFIFYSFKLLFFYLNLNSRWLRVVLALT